MKVHLLSQNLNAAPKPCREHKWFKKQVLTRKSPIADQGHRSVDSIASA